MRCGGDGDGGYMNAYSMTFETKCLCVVLYFIIFSGSNDFNLLCRPSNDNFREHFMMQEGKALQLMLYFYVPQYFCFPSLWAYQSIMHFTMNYIWRVNDYGC